MINPVIVMNNRIVTFIHSILCIHQANSRTNDKRKRWLPKISHSSVRIPGSSSIVCSNQDVSGKQHTTGSSETRQDRSCREENRSKELGALGYSFKIKEFFTGAWKHATNFKPDIDSCER
jgi:hypothetical protein